VGTECERLASQFAYTHDTQALAFAYIDTTNACTRQQYVTVVDMTERARQLFTSREKDTT